VLTCVFLLSHVGRWCMLGAGVEVKVTLVLLHLLVRGHTLLHALQGGCAGTNKVSINKLGYSRTKQLKS
jgi:hypothetical protein